MPHSTAEHLREIQSAAQELVTVGGRYVHYKDPSKTYVVHYVGLIEATEEPCVVYEAEYEELAGVQLVRTVANFIEPITVDDTTVPRFRPVDEV